MNELRTLRRARRLTQKQLAELAGIEQATISKIESGTDYNYTRDTIQRLSAALDVEPAELFGLPELQTRVLQAIRSILDPAQQAAAMLVLETMANSKAR